MGNLIAGFGILAGIVAVVGFNFRKASPLPEPLDLRADIQRQ